MQGFVLERVTVVRTAGRILDAVDGQIESGRCTAVVGPSGSGKSTLLRVLNRLEEPTSGRVILDGRPITELDVLGLRRRVGLVAQQPVLLTASTDEELRVGRPDLPGHSVTGLLKRVGLPPSFGGRETAHLSGGEAQRLCLARTLAVEPETLLLDEPTSALDGVNVALISDLARDHVAAGGTVVLVSHDLAVVRRIASHVLVLDNGCLTHSGHPDDIDYLDAG